MGTWFITLAVPGKAREPRLLRVRHTLTDFDRVNGCRGPLFWCGCAVRDAMRVTRAAVGRSRLDIEGFALGVFEVLIVFSMVQERVVGGRVVGCSVGCYLLSCLCVFEY